jgi:hypothetical protein
METENRHTPKLTALHIPITYTYIAYILLE